MLNACFIDTNILLYAKDLRVPTKRERARAWLDALAARGLAVVSPQVLNEFAHNVIKKLPGVPIRELRKDIDLMRVWCTAPLEASTTLEGLNIHARYQLSFYDALLLASAIARRCDVFLSEDLTHDQRLAGIRIVDPFVTEPLPFLSSN